MKIDLYHNPRCSKSRQTLALLEESNAAINIIEYLKQVPSKEALAHIANLLGKRPGELIRTKEEAYKNAAFDLHDDQAALDAMTTHPILIERPIVVAGDKAAIGRPPESVLEIL